jgi:hypothetical protein
MRVDVILALQTRTGAIQKQEFQRLIAELKTLAEKTDHSQGQIASELGFSLITINHFWLTGHSSIAKRKNIERLRTFLAGH